MIKLSQREKLAKHIYQKYFIAGAFTPFDDVWNSNKEEFLSAADEIIALLGLHEIDCNERHCKHWSQETKTCDQQKVKIIRSKFKKGYYAVCVDS